MSTCPLGKIQHATREAAIEHQKRLVFKNHVEKQDERSKGLNVYPCPDCAAWHVGHLPSVPWVYHYTVGGAFNPETETYSHFDKIVEDGFLRPDPRSEEPNPLLWFSWNQQWEASVIKRAPGEPPWRSFSELTGNGLFRWAAPASVAKLRWNDYLALNKTENIHRDSMAQYGNPADWLATDQVVDLTECRKVEMYYRGRWTTDEDILPEEFKAYLAGRGAAYGHAELRLYRKASGGTDEDVALRAFKILVSQWQGVMALDRAIVQEVYDYAAKELAILDGCVMEDDAEAILLADYHVSLKHLGWKLRNWEACLRFARQQDVEQQYKDARQRRHGKRRLSKRR